jgi:hypothetical protein
MRNARRYSKERMLREQAERKKERMVVGGSIYS